MTALLTLALCLCSSPPADVVARAIEAERQAAACQAALDLECVEAVLRPFVTPDVVERLEVNLATTLLRRATEAALGLGRPDVDPLLKALLRAQPAFEAGGWAPEWVNRLEGVRRAMPDVLGPTIAIEPEVAVAGQAASLVVVARDPSGMGPVRLVVRDPTDGTVRMFDLATTDGQHYPGRIPVELVTEPGVAYWVLATDQAGNRTTVGSPEAPRIIAVQPAAVEPETPVIKTWWFWTATIGGAAILAGASVLTWYLVQDDPSEAPVEREYGGVKVEVEWPK